MALDAWLRATDRRGPRYATLTPEVARIRGEMAKQFGDGLPPVVDAPWLRDAARTADPDPATRAAAARRLAGVASTPNRDRDLLPVVVLLDDEDAAVRTAAREALSNAGGPRTLAAFDVWLRVAAGRPAAVEVDQVRAARDNLAKRLEPVALKIDAPAGK